MKRAALYLRVSTVDQHPETQLHDLRHMASQRGYQIAVEFTDRISGTKARRPGLDQLMTGARRGQFDVVLVWASDRIARSVRHFLDILDEFNRLDIEFVSFREQIDTGGPLGRALVVRPPVWIKAPAASLPPALSRPRFFGPRARRPASGPAGEFGPQGSALPDGNFPRRLSVSR